MATSATAGVGGPVHDSDEPRRSNVEEKSDTTMEDAKEDCIHTPSRHTAHLDLTFRRIL